ncbi:MAG: hypothetical protein ACM3MN_05950, partial [Nitrospirota bacterium]
MSQLIACRNAHGIVLAADSLALDLDRKEAMVPVKTERFLPLGDHAAILTGGASEGTGMCRALKRFVAEEGLHNVEDIYRAALPFLASEYELFMRKKCQVLPVDPLHHLHFII